VDFLKKSADLFHFFVRRGERKMMSAWELMVCCDLNRVLQIWILVETFSGSHPWREISMTEEEIEPPAKHMSGRRTKRFDFNQKYCAVK